MTVGQRINVSGCVTKEKFLRGRSLGEIERILGFHRGRLAGGVIIAALTELSPFLRLGPLPLLHHPRPQPFLDQAHDPWVSHPMFHKPHQPIMLEMVHAGSIPALSGQECLCYEGCPTVSPM